MVCARKGLLCRSPGLEAVPESSQPDPHSAQTRAGSAWCIRGLGPSPLGPGENTPQLCLFLLILAKWPLSKTDPWESRTAWYLHTKDPCCPKLVSPPRRAPSLKGCNPPMQWLRRKKRHKATGMRQTSQQQTRNITNPVPVPAAPDLIVYWKFWASVQERNHYCAPNGWALNTRQFTITHRIT